VPVRHFWLHVLRQVDSPKVGLHLQRFDTGLYLIQGNLSSLSDPDFARCGPRCRLMIFPFSNCVRRAPSRVPVCVMSIVCAR